MTEETIENILRKTGRYNEKVSTLIKKLKGAVIENARLRAALANSKGDCVYCSLPSEEWAKCKSGFPGCARADDAVGCPEMGASMENADLKSEIEALKVRLARAIHAWEASDAQVSALKAEVERLREALEAIEDLCDGEIKARFTHPHLSEKEVAGRSQIYSILSVTRNIARQALPTKEGKLR